MPQFAQRLGLNLTNAFTGDVELLADLFEGGPTAAACLPGRPYGPNTRPTATCRVDEPTIGGSRPVRGSGKPVSGREAERVQPCNIGLHRDARDEAAR